MFLFTCVALRAIYLESTADLSAEEFLHCFIARRGKAQQNMLDKAPQFKFVMSCQYTLLGKTQPGIQIFNQILSNKESNGRLYSNYFHGWAIIF